MALATVDDKECSITASTPEQTQPGKSLVNSDTPAKKSKSTPKSGSTGRVAQSSMLNSSNNIPAVGKKKLYAKRGNKFICQAETDSCFCDFATPSSKKLATHIAISHRIDSYIFFIINLYCSLGVDRPMLNTNSVMHHNFEIIVSILY